MHNFLSYLTRHSFSAQVRYGATVFALIAVTLFRVVVPLDAAPFLLYLPIVFLISVALGRGPGYVGTLLSAVLAATFFVRADRSWWHLATSQWVALIEYLLVCTGMVRVCVALRQILLDNEVAVGRLKAIVDTVPVGIMLAEAPSGRILERNTRLDQIVGASGGPSKTQKEYGKWRAFHADGRRVEGPEYPLARVLKGEQEAALEVHYERQDGSRVWLALTAAPIRNAAGVVKGAVVAVLDVDARKNADAARESLLLQIEEQRLAAEQARDAAEGANRAKSAFLANMSHELRTPLSAVIGYTELLEEDATEAEDPSTLLDLGKIKSNAKHLLGLINDILDLSKVEANKMELLPEDILLPAFLQDTVGTVDALIARKRNQLVLTIADDLGTMRTDAVKLRQCLLNLLSNAAKFTEDGVITFSAHRESEDGTDWVLFRVRDSGIGMTPEQVSRLFQRFTQADETTTRKFGGTGLGLALSRAFSRLMGGDIDVESELGQGTTFTIRLPAALPEHRVEHEAEVIQHSYDETRGSLVLVIDDEAAQRELMTRFLQRQGFVVRTAVDGESGIELVRALRPRAVLLDVMLPGIDGWAVLKMLKADPVTQHIPVVMVSFVADPSISASLGAFDAIPKPINWPRLTNVLVKLRQDGGDVLVVDDDADLRARLRVVLEKNGWLVDEASHGEEALQRVALKAPHLILLDLTMPVMDGFSFLQHLRRMPASAHIPVVVLTARDITREDRERLSEADKIISKGEVSLREISAEIQRLARGPQV